MTVCGFTIIRTCDLEQIREYIEHLEENGRLSWPTN